MGSGFLKKKKQARLFQEQLSGMQEAYSQKLEQVEVSGSAGNGLVSITLNGAHELKKISINPECVDPEDIEGLEVLIRAAFQDASTKLQSQADTESMLSDLPNLSSLGM